MALYHSQMWRHMKMVIFVFLTMIIVYTYIPNLYGRGYSKELTTYVLVEY